jgi:hypothetical protein
MYRESANEGFGSEVSVSAIGNILAIGSPGLSEIDEPGYVRVFSLAGTDDRDAGMPGLRSE